MKITGIIAEYNPFHNGHAYQLSRARQETGADFLVVAMSGNFMQRGVPALIDKFTRAKMALSGGADLVIELPSIWATASAEYFARAGLALLSQLGCIDSLCFGCETPDTDSFGKICQLLCHETPQYQSLLANHLKEGAPYALAREKAVLALLPHAEPASIAGILRNPNNILALEYQKAAASLPSPIAMHPIKRIGPGYHSKELHSPSLAGLSGKWENTAQAGLASASAIRSLLSKACGNTAGAGAGIEACALKQFMPEAAWHCLSRYHSSYPFIFEDDISQMLHYCLLKDAKDGFSSYADCPQSLSNKICRNLDAYKSFSQFCALLKSKDIAYARIRRALIHIFLGIRADSYLYWGSHFYVPYARILGFRRKSGALLSHIKKHSSIPLLTRAADAPKKLCKDSLHLFEECLFADSAYRALAVGKGGQAMPDEYRQQIVVIP